MRVRLYVTAVLGLLCACAQAQLGIYGKVNLTHYNDQVDRTSHWFYGPGAGIYYDFFSLGPLALGADLRGSYGWNTGLEYRDVLGGLRLVAKPPVLPIRPYVQGSVGVGGVKATNASSGYPQTFSNKFTYEVLGGVDFTILPYIDLRLPEVGYGQITGVSGGLNPPRSTLFEVSTGIVIRLP